MPGDAFGLAAEGHEGRAGVRGSRALLDETASERPSTSLQWVVTRRASRAPAAAKKRAITRRCHAWHSTNRAGYDGCYGSAHNLLSHARLAANRPDHESLLSCATSATSRTLDIGRRGPYVAFVRL